MSTISSTRSKTPTAKTTRAKAPKRTSRPTTRPASRTASPKDQSIVSKDAGKAEGQNPINFDSWKTMRKGTSSNDVKSLQRTLNKELGLSLKDDGKFGSKTLDAVKQFQEKHNLNPDGIVGSQTRGAMQGNPPGEAPKVEGGPQKVGETTPGQATQAKTDAVPGEGRFAVDPKFKEKLPAPLQGLADKFQQAGQKYNVDPKFLAAISMMETGKGTSSAFRNKKNAMGVSNSKGPIRFNDPAESIERMAKGLANPKGYYRKATTINQIGRIYAPPGAGNDPNGTNGHWPAGVSKYYKQLGGDPAAQVVFR